MLANQRNNNFKNYSLMFISNCLPLLTLTPGHPEMRNYVKMHTLQVAKDV